MSRLLLGLILTIAIVIPANAQTWITLKGRVTWKPKQIFNRKKIDKKGKVCDRPKAKGPLLDPRWIINPKNKGVKDAVAYLGVIGKGGAVDVRAKMPIHPTLVKLKKPSVVLDQPCCEFEPRILCVRQGQDVIIKNSSAVDAHNSAVLGGKDKQNRQIAPSVNPIIPPGGQVKLLAKEWGPSAYATPVTCSIHPWMKAHVRVFNHPYFSVTDENGNFELKNVPVVANVRLIIWHPELGWIPGPKGRSLPKPKKGSSVVDLGKVEVEPDDDE